MKKTKASIITVDGITVELSRKRIKNIYMRVSSDGTVRVSAPYGTPDRAVSDFVRSKEDWIREAAEKARKRAAENDIDEASRPAYRAALKAAIDQRLPYWESRMGLKSSGYRIRYMKSRWGSCNHNTRMLCFNLRLALYDPECLDYVIVHELAHIREPNHSPDFWKIVEKYIPDYKARRKQLK